MKKNHVLFVSLFFCLIAGNAYPQGISAHTNKLSPTVSAFLTPSKNLNTAGWGKPVFKLVCANFDEITQLFKEVGISLQLRMHHVAYHTYILPVPDSVLLKKICLLPSVSFIDFYHEPREELEVGNFDNTVNTINALHSRFPQNTGAGLTVSVKENQFDTLDIDFRGRLAARPAASPTITNHASVMASIIGGAGNTSSGSLGVAPGVLFSSSNFANLFPDAATQLQQLNVSVQNHSYGTLIENFYGAEARAYDQQMNSWPELAHLFSSGNIGNQTPATGTYTGVTAWANLSGNFKSAKNIITVSAIDSFGRIIGAISRGPAYDGRIKPEMAAFAEDGSSGSTAVISGAVAVLQHLYKQQYGALPAFALLKAILFNSASDVGNAGIDFITGFGSLNALKAAENVVNGRFFSGTVANGNTQTFNINIPAGIHRAKFTLVWNDPAAALLNTKALVNDLDLTVVHNANNQVWQPWVLNHYPHTDSLQQLPVRKKDSLNNAEQVTIDLPAAGSYSIKVNGFSVPAGNQDFYIAWQLDSVNSFVFTHPVKGDHFRPGKPNTIRWQHTLSGNGSLQYSYDNISWNPVATVNLAPGYYVWTAPDTVASLKLRMIAGSTYTSDTFTLSAPPIVNVGFNCIDDFMLWWNRVRNTGNYKVYRLGARYMEEFTTVTDTFVVYTKNSQPALHYAIRPILNNGVPAERSLAYNYTAQGVDCYIRSFLGELQGNSAALELQLGTNYGVQQVVLEKWQNSVFVTLQTIPATGAFTYNFTDNNLLTGSNIYRARVVRAGGATSYSETAIVYYFGKQLYLVYPNPVRRNGNIILLSSALNGATFSLYNIHGQQVYTRQIALFEETIPVSRIGSGVYFYQIVNGKEVQQKGKLIIF